MTVADVDGMTAASGGITAGVAGGTSPPDVLNAPSTSIVPSNTLGVSGSSKSGVSSPEQPHVTLSLSLEVPHTMLSTSPLVPQTMLSASICVPQTMLSSSPS